MTTLAAVRGMVARHSRLLISCVAALALLNAGHQFWLSRSDTLVAWKGGGFGMYTEPHDSFRAVWLVFGSEPAQALRLWPETEAVQKWRQTLPPRSDDFLGALAVQAGNLRFYPRARQAEALRTRAARVLWPAEMTSGVLPADGKAFTRAGLGIVVTQLRHDIPGAMLRREIIFDLPPEAPE